MTPDETILWDVADAGARFSDLCERLAMSVGEDAAAMPAAGYLQTCVNAGPLARDKDLFWLAPAGL